ncbi:MAG: Gfo/Idh/MocA family oxidoreductase [Planctomycetia bacterium]|nr:Gfo/Idh/MocA family oxidoreductase [Planctomycetia bacterium]
MTILSDAKSAWGTPANDKVNLGFLGCGGRGTWLINGFLKRDDINVASLCDPVQRRREGLAKIATEAGMTPKLEEDYRKVLDDPSVDAVITATPDHWHALHTVQACQAGKDVYVEKPASHSAWEGKKMVEAARKYKRVVQVGTQNRSAPYNMAAKKYIEEGKLGKIHFVRVFNMKEWLNFNMGQVEKIPEGLNWDLWSGPAPMHEYIPTYFYNWHHFWDYSSGDIINDGIHQIDLARWLVGKELPKTVYSVGGRYNSTGGAETPDTQIATFEYDDLLFNFELTLYTPYMLKIDGEVRENDMFPYWPQCATRIEIYGDKALMIVGRHGGGWEVYVRTKERKPVVVDSCYGRFPDPEHRENFIQCIRSRELPNADIDKGYKSALLAEYATISYRLGGQKLSIDTETGTIKDCPESASYYKRTYRDPFVVPDEV